MQGFLAMPVFWAQFATADCGDHHLVHYQRPELFHEVQRQRRPPVLFGVQQAESVIKPCGAQR